MRNRVLLLVCILTALAMLGWLRLSHPMPLHPDEWYHVTDASLLKAGETDLINNYQPLPILLLSTASIAGIDIVSSFWIFPLLSFLLISIAVYIILRDRVSPAAGLFGIFFMLTIPSDAWLLGVKFFLAHTLALPFALLSVHFLDVACRKKETKTLVLTATLWGLAGLSHMSIALFASIPMMITAWKNKSWLSKQWAYMVPAAITALAITILLLMHTTLTGLLKWALFTPASQDYVIRSWTVLLRYGWVQGILAIVGIWRYGKQLKQFVQWLIAGTILFITYKLFSISPLVGHDRVIFLLAAGLSLFSASGTYYIISKTPHTAKPILIAVIALVLASSFFAVQGQIKALVPKDAQTSYLMLKKMPEGNVMIPPYLSAALYPLSGKKPVACYRAWNCLNSTNYEDFTRTNLSEKFFFANCTAQEQILQRLNHEFRGKHNASYIFSPIKLNCSYPLIQSTKNSYVYDVRKLEELRWMPNKYTWTGLKTEEIRALGFIRGKPEYIIAPERLNKPLKWITNHTPAMCKTRSWCPQKTRNYEQKHLREFISEFYKTDCPGKRKILRKLVDWFNRPISKVWSEQKLKCGYPLIYKAGNIRIYDVSETSQKFVNLTLNAQKT